MSNRESVLAAVRERVDPTPAEREQLAAAVEALRERAVAAIADRDVDADVRHVGSTARGTWVSGDRDIDLFVRFPPETDRDRLEELGLAIGHEVLPDGHQEYAEHPYVKGTFEGYDVDLVPCYRVASATDIRSAVDRTPFHDAYLRERIDEPLAADVRLLKQFLKGVGVYGSDLRTRGFSGYLTELLALEYGGFEATLEAAAGWHPPVELDPEGHGEAGFDDPLIVIDPTDPDRNVAAVVAPEKVAACTHYARSFRERPSEDLFFPAPPEPATREDVAATLDERDTHPLAVRFDAPDLVPDQLYPQLRRSLRGLTGGLEDAGFDVVRSETFADGDAVLLVEVSVRERPAIERHEGPPVAVAEHAAAFLDAYADDPDVFGPYVDGDRYVVERPRDVRTAEEFVRARLFDVALGTHVESAIEDGYDLLVGDDVAALADDFGVELARYFDPSP